MSIASKAEAEVILKPHMQNFWKCIQAGWGDYLQSYPGVRAIHEPRTRANLIRDHIVSHAKREFLDKPETEIIERDGTLYIGIGKRFLIRFKKLTDQLQSSNYPTYQQLCFAKQMTMPGFFPFATQLVAGYVPNDLWTQVQSAYITCSRLGALEWYIQIDEEPTSQAVIDITPQQTSGIPFRRVRPKAVEGNENKAENDGR